MDIQKLFRRLDKQILGHKSLSFSQFTEITADSTEQAQRSSTAKNYITALKSLQRYMQKDEIEFSDITQENMFNYQRWLLSQGIRLNTAACYMRSLRSIYNKSNHGSRDTNPFAKVFTGQSSTHKRAIGIEQLKRLQALSLPKDSWQERARDFFLFCFCTMGMPFVDMVFLRKSQINGNLLIYQRRKTGQRVEVMLEPICLFILKKYEDKQSDYAFNLLKENSHRTLSQQYQVLLCQYNRALRQLTQIMGDSVRLSSYVARHTWASMAYRENIDVNIISQALGHTDTKTTRIYIQQINNVQLAAANRQLLDLLDTGCNK